MDPQNEKSLLAEERQRMASAATAGSAAPGSVTPERDRSAFGLAIAGMVLGILSNLACLMWLASIPGVICSHLALGRIRRSGGTAEGKPMAIAGLILSYINIVGGLVGLLLCALLFVPAAGQASKKAEQVRDMNNIKQLSLGVLMYTDDSQAYLPADLGAVWPYVGDGAIYVLRPKDALPPGSPEDVRAGRTDYLYLLDAGIRLHELQSPAQTPMIATRPGVLRIGGVNVGYVDGHVQYWGDPLPEEIRGAIDAVAGVDEAAVVPLDAVPSNP